MADAPSTNPNVEVMPPSPGETLAEARRAASLSFAELAHQTKIRTSILQALEEERHQDLPNARVYIRGFVRSFAAAVGLEPDAITARYLDIWQRWRDQGRGTGV